MAKNAWVEKVKRYAKKNKLTYKEAMIELGKGKTKAKGSTRRKTKRKPTRSTSGGRSAAAKKKKAIAINKTSLSWQDKLRKYKKETGATHKEAMLALKSNKTIKDIGKFQREKAKRVKNKCTRYGGRIDDGRKFTFRIDD